SIPDYVGWRDHTDGHRITTTRGDKIEVIGGNYKIVSLGRGTGVAWYEMSGGVITDAMEAPGNQTSVTWRDCPTTKTYSVTDDAGTWTGSASKGWKVVSQTVNGNEVSRYHGSQREEFYGDELISVTGSPKWNPSTSELSIGAGSDGDHAFLGGWAGPSSSDLDGGSATTDRFDADGQDEDLTGDEAFAFDTKAFPTKWDVRGGQPDNLPRPKIYESTWAESVTSYTKVYGKVNEEEHFVGGKETHTYVIGTLTSYSDYFHMLGSLGHFEHFHGAKTEFFFGASTTVGMANRFELFLGLEEQVNIGGSIELTIPNRTEGKLVHLDSNLKKAEVEVDETKAALKKTNAALNSLGAYLQKDVAASSKKEAAIGQQMLALKTDL
ncbi:MAG: hypothetical protein JRI23_14920, partial [Deltaproteobacteria bacterium]|nr:hypothetical protein [Deltaproteobacteria bacterium]MBW2533042.1 hypothetical protein [Deltaproteobacteria bacterium]